MIKTIVDAIKSAVEKHKGINDFTYDLPTKVLGTGEKRYPHFYLESPIRSASFDTETSGLVEFTLNVDVLLFGGEASEQQSKAEKMLYQVISKINEEEKIRIYSLDIMGLTRYTDDNTNGVRASIIVGAINDYSRCVDDDEFEEGREFPKTNDLTNIDTTDAKSCEGEYHSTLKKIKL